MLSERLDAANLPKSKIALRLTTLLQRNGCFRFPRQDLRQKLGQRYKKGWEARFVLESVTELLEVGRLVRRLGLRPGRSYRKRNKWVQPIYGEHAVKCLSSWLRSAPNHTLQRTKAARNGPP